TRDQYHREAKRLWPNIDRGVTGNHVIHEVARAFARSIHSKFAAEAIAAIYADPDFDVLEVTRNDELEALRWMRRYGDQSLGFSDCVSFAMMQRYRISTAFTFDRHFWIAGFSVIGGQKTSFNPN